MSISFYKLKKNSKNIWKKKTQNEKSDVFIDSRRRITCSCRMFEFNSLFSSKKNIFHILLCAQNDSVSGAPFNAYHLILIKTRVNDVVTSTEMQITLFFLESCENSFLRRKRKMNFSHKVQISRNPIEALCYKLLQKNYEKKLFFLKTSQLLKSLQS